MIRSSPRLCLRWTSLRQDQRFERSEGTGRRPARYFGTKASLGGHR